MPNTQLADAQITVNSAAHLDLMTALLIHLLLRLFPLFCSLDLTRHLHDLDLGQWTCE